MAGAPTDVWAAPPLSAEALALVTPDVDMHSKSLNPRRDGWHWHLNRVRLSGILATLDVRNQQAITEKLSHVEFLERLLEDEIERRGQKQLEFRLRRATVDRRRAAPASP